MTDEAEKFNEEVDRLLDGGESAPAGESDDPRLQIALGLRAALTPESPSPEFRARLKAELLERYADNIRPFPAVTQTAATVITPPPSRWRRARQAVVAVAVATAASVALVLGYNGTHHAQTTQPSVAQVTHATPTATTPPAPRPSPRATAQHLHALPGDTQSPPGPPAPPDTQHHTIAPPAPTQQPEVAQYVTATPQPTRAPHRAATPRPQATAVQPANSPTRVALTATHPPLPTATEPQASPTSGVPSVAQATDLPLTSTPQPTTVPTNTAPPATPRPTATFTVPPSPTPRPTRQVLVAPVPTKAPVVPTPHPTHRVQTAAPTKAHPTATVVPTSRPVANATAVAHHAVATPRPTATTSPPPAPTHAAIPTSPPAVATSTPVPQATATDTAAPATPTTAPATATAVPNTATPPPAATATTAPDTATPQPTAPQPTLVAQVTETPGKAVAHPAAQGAGSATATATASEQFPAPGPANAAPESPLAGSVPFTPGATLQMAAVPPPDPGQLGVFFPASRQVSSADILRSLDLHPDTVKSQTRSKMSAIARVDNRAYTVDLQSRASGYRLKLTLITAVPAAPAQAPAFDAASNARTFLNAHRLAEGLQQDVVTVLPNGNITVTFNQYEPYRIVGARTTITFNVRGVLLSADVRRVDTSVSSLAPGITATTALAEVGSGYGLIHIAQGIVPAASSTITGTAIIYVPVTAPNGLYYEPVYQFTGATGSGTPFQVYVPAVDRAYLR